MCIPGENNPTFKELLKKAKYYDFHDGIWINTKDGLKEYTIGMEESMNINEYANIEHPTEILRSETKHYKVKFNNNNQPSLA